MRENLIRYLPGFALLSMLVACSARPTLSPSPALAHTPTVQFVSADALVITNGTVIDGTGADPLPEGIVVIQGNHIVAVGRAADFAIPPKVDVIDAKGGTIIPGIINAHAHGTSDPTVRRIFLAKGVTTVCDLGAPLSMMPDFEQDQTSRGSAARGFRAGPIVTAPGGYPGPFHGFALNYEVSTPDEARAAVLDLLERGADMIKLALEPGWDPHDPWPVLDPEDVRAIVAEAHAHGVPVRAHVTQAAMLDVALEAGVDAVEHIPSPQLSQAEAQSPLEGSDHFTLPSEFEAQLARLVEQRVVMVPTLDVVDQVVCDRFNPTPEQRQLCIDLYLEVVRRFHALGGIVALGNDYGNPGIRVGMPMREMELLLAAGLTPMEVIQAGTSRAAQVCGHGDELGTLEPGKLADIIIVDGDPLTDMEAMSRVVVVIKDGQVAYTSE
jgi:imidazolonepropionase-like amidohydrolase